MRRETAPTEGGRTPWARVAAALFGVGWGGNQFASLLVAYRLHGGVSVAVSQALFGCYALGLIPMLIVAGPASDRFGRAALARVAVVTSVVATVTLMLGAHDVGALYAGRFLAGAASGLIFAPGTAWIRQLSEPPYEQPGRPAAAARRAAVALSLGFGLGPLAAGLVAQWAPYPLVVSYVPHLVVVVSAGLLLLGAPETVPAKDRTSRVLASLTLRAVGRRRFRAVVAPAAPWVFVAPSVAAAVLPGLLVGRTGGFAVGFAAIVSGLTLAVGVLVQPLARRFDRPGRAGGLLAGLGLLAAGLVAGAFAAADVSLWLAVLAAVLLGAGYGATLVAGLSEVQRMAEPREQASLTAVYYALTYLGFASPLVLAELAHVTSYEVLLLCCAALVALTMGWVAAASTRSPVRTGNPATPDVASARGRTRTS